MASAAFGVPPLAFRHFQIKPGCRVSVVMAEGFQLGLISLGIESVRLSSPGNPVLQIRGLGTELLASILSLSQDSILAISLVLP